MARNLIGDGVVTLITRVLNLFCVAILSIITARLLGPHGRGIYALPLIDAGLVSAVFTGLASSVSYFMLNKKVGRGALIPAFLTAGIFVALGSVVVVVLALLAHQSWAALPAIVSLPFSASLSICLGFINGVKKVRQNMLLGLLSTLLTITLMLLGFYFIGRTPTVAIAVWLITGATVACVTTATMLYFARRLPRIAVPFREYFTFAIKVGLLNLITLLNYRVDVYLVAILASPATLGMYTIAVAAAESLQTVTQVATIITAPHIGSLERSEALKLTSRCVRNNTALAAVLCVFVGIAAPVLIHFLYGSKFMAIIPALRVLLIGVVALSGASALSSYFTLKMGKPEVSVVMASISAAICFIVTMLLLPRIGILGAAIGTAFSYLFAQVLGVWYFCRDTGETHSSVLLLKRDDVLFYRNVVRGGMHRVRAALSGAHLPL